MVECLVEKRGEHIPGSKYLRDYCCVCGEAIRVVALIPCNFCSDCNPLVAWARQVKRNGTMPEHHDIVYHGDGNAVD